MKNINKFLAIMLLGLPSTQALASEYLPGDIRFGAGKSQTLGFDEDYEYTTFEVGYDYDHIFGMTVDYSQADDDFIPNRVTAELEFGYEFGDDFSIKPYASGGAVHMRGNGADGTTWAIIGVGLRVSYKMFYINASYDYLPGVSETRIADETGTYWTWEQHESASLTAGFKF